MMKERDYGYQFEEGYAVPHWNITLREVGLLILFGFLLVWFTTEVHMGRLSFAAAEIGKFLSKIAS